MASHLSPLLGREVTVEGLALRTGGSSGRGDSNFDGTNTNDAIYIPAGPGDPNFPYVFESAAKEAAFDKYIAGESCRNGQRGRISLTPATRPSPGTW